MINDGDRSLLDRFRKLHPFCVHCGEATQYVQRRENVTDPVEWMQLEAVCGLHRRTTYSGHVGQHSPQSPPPP